MLGLSLARESHSLTWVLASWYTLALVLGSRRMLGLAMAMKYCQSWKALVLALRCCLCWLMLALASGHTLMLVLAMRCCPCWPALALGSGRYQCLLVSAPEST